ncbi:hypothetical protein NKI38_26125 [Mesorhizobium sp. M0621]
MFFFQTATSLSAPWILNGVTYWAIFYATNTPICLKAQFFAADAKDRMRQDAGRPPEPPSQRGELLWTANAFRRSHCLFTSSERDPVRAASIGVGAKLLILSTSGASWAMSRCVNYQML